MSEVVKIAPGRLALRGRLDFTNARTIHAAGLALLARGRDREWTLECGELSASNSAALAVMLDWLAVVNRTGKHLHFVGIPGHLQAIARISEVDELLESGI